MTSSGDFFGGTQVALTDVLGDKNFTVTALSAARVPQLRRHATSNLGRRLHYGLSVFDNTQFFYASPYAAADRASSARAPSPPSASPAAWSSAQYPLDKFRRLEFYGRRRARATSGFENAEAEQLARRQQAAAQGMPFFLNNGTHRAASRVASSARRRASASSGRSPAAPTRLGVSYAPGVGGFLSRARPSTSTLRKYLRLGGTRRARRARPRLPVRRRQPPTSSTSAATWSCAAIPYLSFVGNQGFFANARAAPPDHRPA